MDISTVDLRLIKKRLTGSDFKNLLKSKGLKKYSIAKQCGLTYRTLLNWEKELYEPSDESALIVARYLGIIEPEEAEILELKKQHQELKNKIDRLSQ